jgi:serralysin
MSACPFCLEEIKPGARKCPHCQSALESSAEKHDSTVYVVDNGLIRFGKFIGAVLAIFILIGVYLFGFDIKETGKNVSEAALQVQKVLLEIDKQKIDLDKKVADVEVGLRRIAAIESEISGHKQETQRGLEDVKRLVQEIKQHSDESTRIVVAMRTRSLGGNQVQVAVVERETRGIGTERGKLWKVGSTIRFRFLDGEEQDKEVVRKAIDQWSQHVNLKIEETSSDAAELRISFKAQGSWSYIGTDALGVSKTDPTINYAFSAARPDFVLQMALHEFGHALGLQHEYLNPAAGDLLDPVALKAQFQGWSAETIEQNFLKKGGYPGSRPYDPTSIMNYALPRHLFRSRKEEARPGNELSASDIAYISSLYPRE